MKNVLTTVVLGAALVFASIGGVVAQNYHYHGNHRHYHYDSWRGLRGGPTGPYIYYYNAAVVPYGYYNAPYYAPYRYYNGNRCVFGIQIDGTCIGFSYRGW